MKSLSFLLICTFSNWLVLSAADPAARPAPRKPFVSKSGGAAPRPFSPNSPAPVSATNPVQAQPLNSGQAEIISITRSHKTPVLRPVVTSPDEVTSSPTTDNTPVTATGANAQVGKIIDRK